MAFDGTNGSLPLASLVQGIDGYIYGTTAEGGASGPFGAGIGENGSGKSSLFRAIQEFFNRRMDAKPFAEFKNNLDAGLTSGHVTVHFDDGSGFSWKYGGDRQLKQPPTSQTALQVGCLDYRSLLETNFTQRDTPESR